MICKKCGTYIGSEEESCPTCGAKVKITKFPCPTCGDILLSEGERCPRCGNRMKTVAEPKEISGKPEEQTNGSCKFWGILSIIAAVLGAFLLVVLASSIPEATQSLYREMNGKAILMFLGGLFIIGIMFFFDVMTAVKCRKNEFRSGSAKKDAEIGAKLGKIAAIITVIGAVLFLILALMKL